MTQHISARVPWKDNGYDGHVCSEPCRNTSCLRLKGIAAGRNETLEREIAGQPFAGYEKKLPCLSEGGAFMSPTALAKGVCHPYMESNPNTHGHFLETNVPYPAFSYPARPFRWTFKPGETDAAHDLTGIYGIDYQDKREPSLDWKTVWVQEGENQKAVFDYFYGGIKQNKSLLVTYTKAVPFIEDRRRVVMGIGVITDVIPAPEYNKGAGSEGKMNSRIWETMLHHSIRDDRKNGFMFPYMELMDYAKEHPDFDIATATVFASDDYREEFSYATEHVSYDAVIDVLNQSLKALEVIKSVIPETANWDAVIEWVNARLLEVWEDRGAFPGLGAMLCAFGFGDGLKLADRVKDALPEGYDESALWKELDDAIAKLPTIDEMLKKTWADLDSERKSLFRLLSRFSLSPDANVYLSGGGDSKIMKSIGEVLFRNEARQKKGITCADADILANPYILYEKTRLLEDALNVPVKKVDMAVFPIEQLAKRFSLPEPTLLKSGTDMRRIRALAINILEEQSSNGHTFLPASHLVESINALPINPSCLVNGDILANAGLTQFVASEIRTFTCKRSGIDESAFQLQRLHQCDEQIRKSVSKRINAQRHNVSEDWNRTVASEFPNSANDATEQRAHTEKVAVLQELAAARLSVLLGGAGTGKTTLLAILCSSPAIQNGGIRLLAPTGKARVRMTQVIEGKGVRCEALTVAQFLLRSDRYDIRTGRYSLSDKQSANVPATVIIDESSMLTTEMFAALLEALKAAQRIIFVGDPNQLPPIGAGKPFVDVVRHLNQDIPAFPKVGKSYGELTVGRRQRSDAEGSRTDAHLAQWFVRSADECGDDNIFAQLQGNQCGKHLVFKQWRDNDDLERLILETVAGEAGMNGVDDITGFNVSLGGKLASDYCYFNVGAAKSIEDWQILAPVRGMPHGILNINHLLHNKYRDDLVRLSKDGRFNKRKDRSFPVLHFPMGGEQCVYGDKVINVTNKKRDAYPTDTSLNYVANGEIGIDVSQFGRNWDTYPNTPEGHKRFKKSLEYMSVEFASQAGVKYSFSDSDFGEESDAALELAYALTVHKAQGSQFKRVILVLAEPCWLLSTELLYTALTRQTERVVILYNTEAYKLRNYSLPSFSDIARRFTCLFEERPSIVEHEKRWYDEKLIHKTTRGELVRSKSEVIIANALHGKGIPYEYEKELVLGGERKLPDFTVNDAESGRLVYWEHLGMLGDLDYARKWELKKQWYADHGITELGGANGLLIITQDDPNGGIDSQNIATIIREKLV